MSNKETVLNLFIDYPTQGFSLRELERKAKLGLPSVIRYVRELRKERLVVGKTFGYAELLYANRDNPVFRRRKAFRNVEKIYASGLIDFINVQFSYPGIVLFGSKSRGEDTEESDTDIFVQAPAHEVPVEVYEKKIGKVHLFVEPNIVNIPNPHLIANVINGTILEGYLDLEAMLGRVPRAEDTAERGAGKIARGDRGGAARLPQGHSKGR
jgi:predicted nucleotidyltransferase